MRKVLFAAAFALGSVASSVAMAQFTGPSADSVTVADAMHLSDDTPVIMTGYIEKALGGEKYQFKDNTGTIIIKVDDKDWHGVTVNEQDLVEICGEVDKDFMDIKIDVDSITKK